MYRISNFHFLICGRQKIQHKAIIRMKLHRPALIRIRANYFCIHTNFIKATSVIYRCCLQFKERAYK